ncbi:MAG: hypothetical protein NTX50_07390 [Candidatus Sumerlaeota bacterium]|nr:hypothetical protein [Candidatus Sumerlaeota bacterium]
MFGLFKAATFQDDRLGSLTRSGGHWKGSVALGRHGKVELSLSGGRESPDSASVALARELPARYDSLLLQIQASLFEHYEPYRDADSAGELPERSEPFPKIERAEDVWPHVSPEYILIEPLRGSLKDGPTIEIAYRVDWDEEHTVGARIQDWQVWELCGSV